MRKILILVLSMLLFMGAENAPAVKNEAHTEYHPAEKVEEQAPRIYPKCGVVYALEYAEDAVIVQDFTGELWEFYGIEDWMVGDIVAMTMLDAGLPDYIWDDEIIAAVYDGYIEGWE